ncbi:hypothetical protein I4U23_012902 [Adineta vaga]|nr:hypothetical protein I4U23_012902 [Adineta vaga]
MDLLQMGGEAMSDSPDHYIGIVNGNPQITFVELALRTISWMALGANHWAVIVVLSTNNCVCIQFHTNGAVTAHVFNSEPDAALRTSTGDCTTQVRISHYGHTHRTIYCLELVQWLRNRQGKYYVLGVKDCQNFCRDLIEWFMDKWVDW